MTLVSGENGSGKSAIKQALQVCMGVRASATGRAPSLREFIRTGHDGRPLSSACVQVTLRNDGADAFRPDR